jgi:hypothetical protein
VGLFGRRGEELVGGVAFSWVSPEHYIFSVDALKMRHMCGPVRCLLLHLRADIIRKEVHHVALLMADFDLYIGVDFRLLVRIIACAGFLFYNLYD